MSNKKVWFGTEHYMTWVPAPLAGSGSRSRVASRESGILQNGGAYAVSSGVGAQNLSLSWNPRDLESTDELRAFFDGVYGPGPFYYVDPFAEDNALPPYMASPWTNASNVAGPQDQTAMSPGLRNLASRWTSGDTREVATPVPGLPAFFARYTSSALGTPEWNFPVPPGRRLHLAVGGTGSGSIFLNGDAIDLSDMNTFTPLGGQFVDGDEQGWLTLSMSTVLGGLDIRWMQLTYTDKSATGIDASKGWTPGRGFGPLDLAGDPEFSDYMAVLGGRQGVSADFVEAQPWR